MAEATGGNMETREQFKEYLEGNNLKLTPQRERILSVLLAQSSAVSAERLLLEAGGAAYGISLSTLYRALGHLLQAGLARRIRKGAGTALYEAVGGCSCHLICERCGRRVAVTSPYLEGMQEVAARQEGFVLRRCCSQLVGLCPSCAAADRAAENEFHGLTRAAGLEQRGEEAG